MKKLLLIIFILAAILVLYFAYSVISSRYATEEDEGEGEEISVDVSTPEESYQEDIDIGEDIIEEDNIDNSEEISNTEELAINEKPQFTANDCFNDCSSYSNNKENLKYCRKLCGYLPVQHKEEVVECDGLSVNEKDFCLYNLAVSKKEFKLCDGIYDKKTKDACNNRVIDEMFNAN